MPQPALLTAVCEAQSGQPPTGGVKQATKSAQQLAPCLVHVKRTCQNCVSPLQPQRWCLKPTAAVVVCGYAGTGAEGASVGPGSPAYLQQNGQESPAYSDQSLPNSESIICVYVYLGVRVCGDRNTYVRARYKAHCDRGKQITTVCAA